MTPSPRDTNFSYTPTLILVLPSLVVWSHSSFTARRNNPQTHITNTGTPSSHVVQHCYAGCPLVPIPPQQETKYNPQTQRVYSANVTQHGNVSHPLVPMPSHQSIPIQHHHYYGDKCMLWGVCTSRCIQRVAQGITFLAQQNN